MTVVLEMLKGLLPLGQMVVLKLVVDGVMKATTSHHPAYAGNIPSAEEVFKAIGLPLILMALLQMVSSACSTVAWMIRQQLQHYVNRDVQVLILKKANSFAGISAFENPEFYDLLRQAQSEVNWRPGVIILGLANLTGTFLGLASMIAVLVTFQPLLVLVLTVCALPKLIVEFVHGYENWKRFYYDSADGRRMTYYSSLLTSKEHAKEVRMFGLGEFFLDRYSTTFEEYRQRHMRLLMKQMTRTSALSVLSVLGNALSYAYVAAWALAGAITIGSLTLYGQAVYNVELYLDSLINSLVQVYEGDLYATNLFKFLALKEPMVAPATINKDTLSLASPVTIEFKHVAFGYGKEDPVLKDVSFVIEPGQTVALVGENGAGKTTLVKLLSRLYDPTCGQILIDGVDLKELNPDYWRSCIAVVFQDYCHYHMTAGENIGIGRISLMNNLSRVIQASERGGAKSIVDKLPSGYETLLGKWLPGKDEGAELSGGEWQKIALSRAFMRSSEHNLDHSQHSGEMTEAQVLILDEPTSALDVQSEHDIYQRFAELTREKTTLLISHRFSTVKMADKILVLKDGVIVEQGSHEDLMAGQGIYAELFNLQADRYKV